MSYISLKFYCFLLILLLLYYVPASLGMASRKQRAVSGFQNFVLLAGSAFFYWTNSSAAQFVLFVSTIMLSWLFGLVATKLGKCEGNRALSKCFLGTAIVLVLLPMLAIRFLPLVPATGGRFNLIVPLGLSFYSLQIVAYLCDCASGKVKAETDFVRYSLFVSFFPHVIQGPIPRYERLSTQFSVAHAPSSRLLVSGGQRILWGFFLKYMIADKAAVFVDTVFSTPSCTGFYVLVAAVLYSFQLYADFFACVSLSQGVAELFGIQLDDNFRRPYFAVSVQDFWRRWHITLSSWLKDYVYIPLGGNRKGTARKYANILAVFLVSGVWHGTGLNFALWGLLHGAYQIAGSMTLRLRNGGYRLLGIEPGSRFHAALERLWTFLLVTFAWILFRADGVEHAWRMLRGAAAHFNPAVLFSSAFFSIGLDGKDWQVLLLSLAVLFAVGCARERGVEIRKTLDRQHVAVRWMFYIAAITAIWVFGSYGFGYDATDFIYGGF